MRPVQELRTAGTRQAFIVENIGVVNGRSVGPGVQIDERIQSGEQLLDDVIRQPLREGAGRITWEDTVKIDPVDCRETLIFRKPMRIGYGQYQHAPFERHVP